MEFKYLTYNNKYVNPVNLSSYGINCVDRPFFLKENEDFYDYWLKHTLLWIQPEHVSLFYKNLKKCVINKIVL